MESQGSPKKQKTTKRGANSGDYWGRLRPRRKDSARLSTAPTSKSGGGLVVETKCWSLRCFKPQEIDGNKPTAKVDVSHPHPPGPSQLRGQCFNPCNSRIHISVFVHQFRLQRWLWSQAWTQMGVFLVLVGAQIHFRGFHPQY